MKFCILGNSGLRVSTIGLGCMGKNEDAKVIRKAYLAFSPMVNGFLTG